MYIADYRKVQTFYNEKTQLMQKIILKITDENFNIKDYESIECFALTDTLASEALQRIVSQIKNANKIALIYGENSAAICKSLEADGAIFDLSASEHIKKDFDSAKATAGKNKIFGIITRNRRHETMISAECEPDFIIFKVWENLSEKQIELFDWYQEFFLIQSAADMCGDDICQGNINTDILISDEKKYKILVATKNFSE